MPRRRAYTAQAQEADDFLPEDQLGDEIGAGMAGFHGEENPDEAAEADLDRREGLLLAALEAADATSATYYDSALAADMTEAMARYRGEPYGDEVEGRSKVVSRETFEMIEWLKPSLRRMFASGKTIVELEPQDAIEDEWAPAAATYINRLFFSENPGLAILRGLIHDAGLAKVGFVACYFEPGAWGKPETWGGLNEIGALAILQDPNVELLEQDEAEGEVTDSHPDGRYYQLTVRRRGPGKIIIEQPAPEDMRIAASAKTIDDGPCTGRNIPYLCGDLIEEYPEFEDLILEYAPLASWDSTIHELKAARAGEMELDDDNPLDTLTMQVCLKEDFIRWDFDEDGFPELRCVHRLADLILWNVEVDENPYGAVCLNPIAHEFYGFSEHDTVKDVEKVKTVAVRSGLDGMYHGVMPRTVADITRINLGDLLTGRPGGVIRSDGPIDNSLKEYTVTDVSPNAIAMAEYFDMVGERRTGIRRRGQPMDPDQLHKTYKGQKLIENADSERKEEKAANMKEGLEAFFGKLFRLVARNMRHEIRFRVGKQETTIDPRKWRIDMRVTINAGLGTGARDEKVSYLSVIGAAQEKLIGAGGGLGPQNQLVSPRQIWQTADELVRTIGYPSSEGFFSKPEEGWYPPPPPDPAAAKAQAQAQAEIEKSKIKAQADEANAKRKHELDMAAGAAEERLKLAQIHADLEAEKYKIDGELQIKDKQIAAELAIARELGFAKLDLERELAEKGLAGAPGGGTSDVQPGGEPG